MSLKIGKYRLIINFLILYGSLSAILTFVFGAVFYFNFFHQATENIRQEAMTNAANLAQHVDFSGHDQLTDQEDMNSVTYRRIFSDLNFASTLLDDVQYIYTMRPKKNNTWEFVVDAALEKDDNSNGRIDENEISAKIGDEYDITETPELTAGWFGPTADQKITKDIWGEWISGYAPIKDETGRTVGIVGVDISASQIIKEQKNILNLLAYTLVITFLLSSFIALIGIYITRKEALRIQQALQIRNQDLEIQIRKRTETLKKFITVVVHEMRAPMTSVRWGLEMLKQSKTQSIKDKNQLEQMENIISAQLKLITRLLDASRVGIKKLPIEKKPGNLPALIKKMVEEFHPQAKLKNLKLKADIKPGLTRSTFDANRLREVLSNLISNAIKYTNQGSIQIKVEPGKSKNKIRVSVIDTGQGLSSEDQANLFQPFTRIGKSSEAGSGLGLVIAKGIIESHQGKIGLTSKVGKGSTFWFEIPIK